VGEDVGMKGRIAKTLAGAMCLLAAWTAVGCGGGSNKANTVTVVVTGTASVVVPKQSEVITATVTGATDMSATFTCTFTTTPDPTTTTPMPKPSAAASCDTANGAVGNISNTQNTSTTTNSTTTYTAPDTFPDHSKFPNVVITVTATAKADTKRTGTFGISIDSGIRITLTPTTATLATSEAKQFFAQDLNGNLLDNSQLTWGVTFETTAKVDSVTCSGGSNDCGSLTTNPNNIEVYTAPAKVPAAPTQASGGPAVNAAGIVTIFVFSKVDNARIAQGSLTLVAGGTITFNGISPVTVPLGGPLTDIFLNAPNVTSQVGIQISGPSGVQTVDTTNTNAFKVVFAAGSTSSAIGARVRLNPTFLSRPGTYQVQLSQGGTVFGSFPFTVVPVAPSIIGISPDNFQQATLNQTTSSTNALPQVSIDGGYFGGGANPAVSAPVLNNSNALLAASITPRNILGNLPLPGPPSPPAGLFQVSVTNPLGASPLTAHTNVAIIPDYASANPPTDLASPSNPLPGSGGIYTAPAPAFTFPAGSVPSSIALDSTLALGAITLAGANAAGAHNVQFFSVAGGNFAFTATASSGGSVATSVAIDNDVDNGLTNGGAAVGPVAVVVNYASQNLAILGFPGGGLVATVDLSGLFNGITPVPFPYAVGVDPFLHRALVAFASTNIGLIVNLNPDASVSCIKSGSASTPHVCAIGFVTLSTGANPQIAFEALSHIAYVTPGAPGVAGGGILEGVDLSSTTHNLVPISSLTRTANTVTVVTTQPHGINSGIPLFGAPTVLISNVPNGTNGTSFDGSFQVTSVLSDTVFTYAQAAKDDTATCSASATPPCSESLGSVNLAFNVSPSLQGIAVNPITRQLAFADPNVQIAQVSFLDPLTRFFTAMTISKGGVGATTNSGAPEIGEASVAFQPFSNTAVAFNPAVGVNQISLIDPSLLQRPALVNTGQTGNGSVSFTPAGSNTAVALNIPGSIAIDSVGNRVIAANAGSDNLTIFRLGNIKPVHIQELRTPVDPRAPRLLHAALTPTNANPPVALSSVSGVQLFGTGFTGAQVRLDGTPLSSGVTIANDHEIDLTIAIPPALVGVPHRYAVDVVNGGVFSNTAEFSVIGVTPIPPCGTAAAPVAALPGGIAIDEQRNLAVVTNTACAQVSLLSLAPGPGFGSIVGSIATGGTPTGVAVLPRLSATIGVAVVTNNSSGSVSILDLDKQAKAAPDLTVGTNPTGVAINPQTNLTVVANTGSNSISAIDLTPLTASPAGTLSVQGPVGVDLNPIAVAIDPDRGSNGRGLAVVTALSSPVAGGSPTGALDAIDIGGTTPARSTTVSSASFLSTTPTGIFFDPAAATGTANPGLFFGVTSESDQVVSFNPDSGTIRTINVGINPVSVALNSNSGTLVTVNASSNTISLVDAQTFTTREVIGIGGSGTLAVAIHNLLNLAVVVDQGNSRVFSMVLP